MKDFSQRILTEQLEHIVKEYSINDVVDALVNVCNIFACETESLEGKEAWLHDAKLFSNVSENLGDW